MSRPQKNTLLPHRLNGEPSIFRGCSLSELTALVVIGGLTLVPISVIICGLLGFLTMGVGLGLLLVIGWVVVGASILQRLKRDRPIGYYQLWLRLKMEDMGLIKPRFLRKAQIWSTGRMRR